MSADKTKPKFIIQAVRFDMIGWIQAGYKVTWPEHDDRGSPFEMLETTIVKSHSDADLLELRVFEFGPKEDGPASDGYAVLQIWDKTKTMMLSQSAHTFPPKPVEVVPDTGAELDVDD